ncbi:MAG: hypothetical protein AB1776_03680 [Bacillota bacterium]
MVCAAAGASLLYGVFGCGLPWRQVVTKKTVLVLEQVYTCGDCRSVYYGPAPSELFGLNARELRERYPAGAGWTLSARLPEEVRLTRHLAELCPRHRKVRHLGVYRGYLAVYGGPLGSGGPLLRVEKIPVSALNPAQQEKLSLAAAFAGQPPQVQAMLRRDLEFSDEAAIHAVLENLDELQD